jgi:hypothetical protein
MSNIKISREAIEAGVRRYKLVKEPCDGWTDAGVVKEVLIDALKHIIPEKCDEETIKVFNDTFNMVYIMQNRDIKTSHERALNSVMYHLRGEGKQADCNIQPQNYKSQTEIETQVEIDPDDVERVARAMYEEQYCGQQAMLYEQLPASSKREWEMLATAAIRAMKGRGTMYGVWNVKLGKFDFWDSDGPLLTEKKVAEWFVFVLNQRPLCHYEVRAYIAPREESADADEIAKKCVTPHLSTDDPRGKKIVESVTQAIREAEKRGEKRAGGSNG